MGKPTVFISYSHMDEKWKDLLRPHLEVLEQTGRIDIWDDRKIDPGGKWFNDIKGIMDRAAVAVCLISADYLASDFCTKQEIPYLLERCERDGMVLIPVLLRPVIWKAVPWLKETQMLPRDGKSVSNDFKDDCDTVFAEVAERIFDIIDNPDYQPPKPPPPRWSPPNKSDIHRMPMTGAELFGRQRELELLDEAWESEEIHVVSLVAWGGVGKSTLVNKWLETLDADNYRGAQRVYAWSFYSQGTGERVTSADFFIAEALAWFGDPDPKAGSPWDKGERLAGLIRQEKTLLVLDGMEPLQSYLDYERGKINDPALAVLVSELARSNPGLCIITTREEVTDLSQFPETIHQKDLEQISAEAGRALLRVGGVHGTDAEMEGVTRDFGHHALALNLLAAYLHEIPGHHVSNASDIPDLDIPEKEGRHPRQVMTAFEKRFGKGPEVELLRMLGLFDRPADGKSIAALRAAPAIPDLTKHIQELSEADWLRLLNKLRRLRLIASESQHNAGTLDAHPLVREHFGQQLRQEHPDAWREGNNRLYEHLKAAAKKYPDNIEEMMPLYAAMGHGCQAGRHQEALDEVYWGRISRKEEFFSTTVLGAFGADLSALPGFFDPPWRKPVSRITEADQSFVLAQAGFRLRALARLTEATQPMRSALESDISRESYRNAARDAINLSALYMAMGELAKALDSARQSVDLADRCRKAEEIIFSGTALADALHQTGQLKDSEIAFHKSEEMQKELQPEYQLLYSVQGFQYCDLLLDQGRYKDVLSRSEKFFEWQVSSGSLITIALEHLSLGRAHLLQARQEGMGDFSQATTNLNQAVNGLRNAGTQHHIPRGLLARAELYRVQREFDRAERDLDEAMTIATRGGMGLHKADCHLEYARLYLAMEEKEEARERLDSAREMIERMGYHRRDREVEELEEQL